MINYDDLFQKVMDLPVFDTHTHLETGWRSGTQGLYARNFFDICDYFWFIRELRAGGYVKENADPTSLQNAKNLHEGLRRIRNTAWTQTVMQGMENLYGIRPDSPERILELGGMMDENLKNKEWGYQVCDKIGIRKTVMGPGGAPAGTELLTDESLISDRTVRVPTYSFAGKFVKGFDESDPELYKRIDELKVQVKSHVEGFLSKGYQTIRVAWPFLLDPNKCRQKEFTQDELQDISNLTQSLGHYLFELLEEHGVTLQIFFGTGKYGPMNNPGYLADMGGIFDLYRGINFELFSMAEQSALDMVQIARILPNVYPGGLWWYNFRPSIYETNMRHRSEGLPACRSTFVASDARCIEWSYIKILMIKKAMARFFHNRIREGWLDEDAALYTARCWLHDTAARLYLPEDQQSS